MRTIREGKAEISAPEGVFYNLKMAKLRDISVAFLAAYNHRGASLLDCTAASGIRGIRYALEAGIKDVTLIDINEDAAKAAKANVKRNGLGLRVLDSSIQEFANSSHEAFDIIDLDPFGTPVPYVHDLLKLAKGGTLLMVTATDTATLCGAEEKACLKLYGSKPLHNELCHEVGARILLNYIAREAAQFNFGIEPALSVSDMHYIREFLFLREGANAAVRSVKNTGFGSYCRNCHNFSLAKGIAPKPEMRCDNCRKEMDLFGPLWLGSLQDRDVVARTLQSCSDLSADAASLLEKICNEIDVPLFYNNSKITRYLRMGSVSVDKVIASLSKKHSASRTHFDRDGIKTDAGIKEVIASVRKAAPPRARSL